MQNKQQNKPYYERNYPEEFHPYCTCFPLFLKLVWKHLNLPEPTSLQYDIADYLQKGPKRCVIQAYRGMGKSWITASFVVWSLLRDPHLNILVVSASKRHSDNFSIFAKRLIQEIPILQHLYPHKDQRSSNVAFDVAPAGVSQVPSVYAMGIGGALTGSRADIIIADDIEIPNNSETQTMREKIGERIKEFDAILKDKPSTRVIFLGTPQCEDTIYKRVLERGYDTRIWPARYPTSPEKMVQTYGDRLAPLVRDRFMENSKKLANAPTDRFNEEELLERQLSYGRSGFSMQYLLDPRLSDEDRYPLKLKDLITMPLDFEMAPEKLVWSSDKCFKHENLDNVGLFGDGFYGPAATIGDWGDYTGAVMAIDPSGRGKDETAYAVAKIRNGMLYVLDVGGFKGGYNPETLQKIAELAAKYKINTLLTESNFGDGMFTELLKPHLREIHPCEIEETRAHKQKELRIIETIEPLLQSHRIVVNTSIVEKDRKVSNIKNRLFHQMTRLTIEKGALLHDDRIDALSMALGYWKDKLGLTADEIHRERKEQDRMLFDDYLKGNIELSPEAMRQGRPLRECVMHRPHHGNWFDDM